MICCTCIFVCMLVCRGRWSVLLCIPLVLVPVQCLAPTCVRVGNKRFCQCRYVLLQYKCTQCFRVYSYFFVVSESEECCNDPS
jgi:hypothetical protein